MRKTVVVSGASRGLGFCLSRQHLEKGDQVHLIVRGKNEAVAQLMNNFPQDCCVHIGDVSSVAALKPALQEICAGTKHIDILYNVAAIFWPEDRKGICTADIDRMPEMFNVNACGALRVLQGLDARIDSNTHIVNITSESGCCTSTLERNLYAYSMSKAALNLATVIYAREKDWGRNAIVVDPGWMRTDMGGPDANVDPDLSARKIIDLAENMDRLESGHIFFKYTGKALPW